jgi:hypothetical protein
VTLLEERPEQPQMVGIPDTLRHLAVPIDSLQPYHKNARRRAAEIVNDSLRRHGQYRPIVVNRGTLTGRENEILAGNGTWAEARSLDWPFIAATFVDVSEDTAARIVLVDNKANDEAGYDERLLAELLGSLPDLDGTGFQQDELSAILDRLAEEALEGTSSDADDETDEDTDAGTLLALSDVTVGEPTHSPAHGSRWRVGPHLLVIARLSDEHHLWSGDLDGRVFCPYPNPYITASDLGESPLLLVQPNRYLAGHLLDKHEALFPGTVEKL